MSYLHLTFAVILFIGSILVMLGHMELDTKKSIINRIAVSTYQFALAVILFYIAFNG